MSRRARLDVRRLAHAARVSQARRSRALHLIGMAALEGPLSVGEIAREARLSPSTVRRWRDRVAENVSKAPATAPDGGADISAPAGREDARARQRALRALRAMSVGGVAPAVRTYRANQAAYRAPSVEALEQAFGSWRDAVIAAGLEPRDVGRPRRRTR